MTTTDPSAADAFGAGSLTGRRVTWRGPAWPRIGTTASYSTELRAGTRRPPREDEWLHLAPGEHGTIGRRTGTAAGLACYDIDWDGGATGNTTLPDTTIEVEGDQRALAGRGPAAAPSTRVSVRALLTRITTGFARLRGRRLH